jgi:hypothetical protein
MAFNGTGSNVTSLNASNIASGTVPTARLASGTANSTTFLRGDSTWATAGGAEVQGGRGQAFTSNGTFTVPTGVTSVKVTIVGGGAGGYGGTPNYTGWGGGGGGGYGIAYLTGLTPGTPISVTVGGGGGSRTSGGTSSFGGLCTATGGTSSSSRSGNIGAGGAGGTVTGCAINLGSTQGFAGNFPCCGAIGGGGGCPGFGTIIRGDEQGGLIVTRSPAASGVGAGGSGARSSNTNGFDATGYGAGGGGGARVDSAAANGGAGTSGYVLVEY